MWEGRDIIVAVAMAIEAVAKAALEHAKRFDGDAALSGIVKIGNGSTRLVKINLGVQTAIALAAMQSLRLAFPFHQVVLAENAATGRCQLQILCSEHANEVAAAAEILEKGSAFRFLRQLSGLVGVAGGVALIVRLGTLLL